MLLLTDHPDLRLFAAAERKGWTVGVFSMLYWHTLPQGNQQGAAINDWLAAAAAAGDVGVYDREDEVLNQAKQGHPPAVAELEKPVELARWTHRDLWNGYYDYGTANMQFTTASGAVKTWASASHAEKADEAKLWARCQKLLRSQRIALPSLYVHYEPGENADKVEIARNKATIQMCAATVDTLPFICHHRAGNWTMPLVTADAWQRKCLAPVVAGGTSCRGVVWWTAGMQQNLPANRLEQDIKRFAGLFPDVG